jgi:hypothetical protein
MFREIYNRRFRNLSIREEGYTIATYIDGAVEDDSILWKKQ